MLTINDFDYPLSPDRIAQRPAHPRDASNLLVSYPHRIEDYTFGHMEHLLAPGDLLILNDTQVIPGRLIGHKKSGGRVEILLLSPAAQANCWLAWGRANKPLQPGTTIVVADHLEIEIKAKDGKELLVALLSDLPMDVAIQRYGRMPLPPYITASDPTEDQSRYQTIYAQHAGAIAAPTAGLHFTQALLDRLQNKGVAIGKVTLHVGPGTFQPISSEHIEQHVMHGEWCTISQATVDLIQQTQKSGHEIVAVGSTVVRTLEQCALANNRPEPYQGETQLYVRPGFHFKVVTRMITNFHLPRSTLLLLVAAFIGKERLDRDYAHAIEHGYRFYSYGDATFLLPKRG